MSRLRLPLRLARREVRRRPGRTALVTLLIALPVAGMVLATVIIHTGRHTPAEEWERANGQADAAGFGMGPDGATAADLPEGSRAVVVSSTYFRARTPDGHRSDVQLTDLPLNDPITAGIHDLVAGRAPAEAGEVVLSRELAHRLRVGVGDELTLARPDVAFKVVGLIEPIGCLRCADALVAPGEFPAQLVGRYGQDTYMLVDLPTLTTEQTAALEQQGFGLRALSIDPLYSSTGDARSVRWSLVLGAIALTVVGIVISAAFAVGARRQLVTLGQLSASGAPPATVRAALVLQGTLTGLLGGVLGLAIAGGVLLSGRGLFERFLDERIHTYVFSVRDLVLAVTIGVGAATVAALIPARTAARIPTLAALAGRRPLAPVSRRLVAGGFVAMAAGLGLLGLAAVGSRSGGDGDLWAFVAVVGGVGELLGACAIAPAIVARLEPLAHRLSGSLRLGARSLARNRARTGAVVSAVAAAGALAVAAGALVLGGTARDVESLRVPDDVAVIAVEGFDDATGATLDDGLPDDAILDEVRTLLVGASEFTVRGTATASDQAIDRRAWSTSPPVGTESPNALEQSVFSTGANRAYVADDALLEAIHAGSEVRSGLDDTGIVLLTQFGNGDIDVTVPGPSATVVPGRAVHQRYNAGYITNLLITEDKAAELGLEVVPVASMFRTPADLTEGQRDGLEDIQFDSQLDIGPGGPMLSVQWSSQQSGPTPFQVELILSAIALIFSLFVVGVSLALAAAESKDERDILTIAGAPPAALARSAGARAWLLAVIGAGMAIPVGFLPVIVFSYASQDQFVDERFPLVFPTRTVLLLVLAVPAIVSAVSFAGSAAAQRLHPVRVSTATFE